METEYLVIGAGSAGNVVARRLLDAGKKVTVLEADRKSTRLNSSHTMTSRMPSSA